MFGAAPFLFFPYDLLFSILNLVACCLCHLQGSVHAVLGVQRMISLMSELPYMKGAKRVSCWLVFSYLTNLILADSHDFPILPTYNRRL